MIILKILVDLICGALNSWGGYDFLAARRYIMPVLLGVTLSILTHTWWLGLTVLPVMGTLCLKYFGPKFWGRGLWLGLQALVIGAGAVLTGHLLVWLYIPYVIVAFLLAGLLYNLKQIIGDAIFGVALGLIVYLVH